jgi:hypothetical protein
MNPSREGRFSNAEKKLMAKMKFPEEFKTKVIARARGMHHYVCGKRLHARGPSF